MFHIIAAVVCIISVLAILFATIAIIFTPILLIGGLIALPFIALTARRIYVRYHLAMEDQQKLMAAEVAKTEYRNRDSVYSNLLSQRLSEVINRRGEQLLATPPVSQALANDIAPTSSTSSGAAFTPRGASVRSSALSPRGHCSICNYSGTVFRDVRLCKVSAVHSYFSTKRRLRVRRAGLV